MFVSVLETLCTDSDTPGPLLPGHSMAMTPPIMSLVTRTTGSLHTPLWSVRIPQGTCGNWRYVSFPMILRLFTKFDHQPLNSSFDAG